nr:DUF6883 domain-containing protein [Methylobacterium iners]
MSGYLLNPNHQKNGGKAQFFLGFGWTAADPETFSIALLEHARPELLVNEAISPMGDLKLIFEGPVPAPDGRTPNVRSVWQVEGQVLRFVTAVPLTGQPRPPLTITY